MDEQNSRAGVQVGMDRMKTTLRQRKQLVRQALGLAALVGLVLAAVGAVRAEDPPNAAAEKAALQKRAEEFVAAFNKGDADAVAAFWAPEGDYMDQAGETLKGRQTIAAAFRKQFEAVKGGKMRIHPTSLRFVKPDLAIEDGITEVVPSDGGPPTAARYTVVHVKVDGRWYLSSVRDAVATPSTNAQYLQPITWLLGDWVDEGQKGEQVEVSYTWAENQNFLVSSFATTSKGAPIAGGTQWVGWDAANKSIVSWTFDSNGGHAQAIWSTDGPNKWTAKTVATLGDGQKLTATNTLTKVDADHFTWRSTGRTLDGKSLPDTEVIKMKRSK
jgi:uncharacterized protein (TIGR02246 family)